jgi:IS5 family transposase
MSIANQLDHVSGNPLSKHEQEPRPTQRALFLQEMERSVPWAMLCKLVAPCYASLNLAQRPKIEPMLRIYFLQHWFSLADHEVEEALLESVSMFDFICAGLPCGSLFLEIPALDVIASVRTLLQQNGFGTPLFEAVNRHLHDKGLRVTNGHLHDASVTRHQVGAPSKSARPGRLAASTYPA